MVANALRHVLERDGVQVEASSVAELSGETLNSIESRHLNIVCISDVPPSGFMHVRYLYKRITGRYPRLPIVAGMRTLDLENQELADRLPIIASDRVAASLGEVRTEVCRLTESARIGRRTALAAVVAASA
jgi:hypothetical protein